MQSGGGGGGIGGGGRMAGGAFGSSLLRSVASICASSAVSLSLPIYGTKVVVVSPGGDDVAVSFARPMSLSSSPNSGSVVGMYATARTPTGSRSSIVVGVGGGGAKSVVDTLTRAIVWFS